MLHQISPRGGVESRSDKKSVTGFVQLQCEICGAFVRWRSAGADMRRDGNDRIYQVDQARRILLGHGELRVAA
jgi:hypothetical protein